MVINEEKVRSYLKTLSNWGRWGGDDQLGTLNYITTDKRVGAARSVSVGVNVGCARTISPKASVDNPEPLLHHMLSSGVEAPPRGMYAGADWFGMVVHGYSFTHLDAHCHLIFDGMIYNNRPASLLTTPIGSSQAAIEVVKDGIVGRGVLLDIPRFRGTQWLDPGDAIYPDELTACAEAQATDLFSGDILIVSTGRDARRAAKGPWSAAEGGAGLHAACLPWLHEREIAVLVGDGANDVHPSGVEGIHSPVHSVAIVGMGMWLLDNAYLLDLAQLCADLGRWDFLFTIAPLRLKNSTGSPVTPVAVL